MSELDKRLKAIAAHLGKAMDSGTWEPEQKEATINAMRNLQHVCKRRNRKALEKAIANLAKAFLRSVK